ncbi:neutral zinc metallopeptidase [Micrococcales bacterium 31B]|nr:neutral zinc metallopeptidase [Micrococcales bacterium 31B]
MSFDPNAHLDGSQVSNRRGGGGGGGLGGGGRGFKIGGGIGGAVLLLVVAIVGGPDMAAQLMNGGDTTTTATETGADMGECLTGADANAKVDCRVVGTVNSLNAFWQTYLPEYGTRYRVPQVALESGTWSTGCGTGSSDMGPFYCPADESVYIDTAFYGLLQSQYGSSGGPLAQEYVVAHEFGHHIQNLIGTINYAQQDPQGPESGGVRVELQADCFAGLWVKHATTTPGPGSSAPLIPTITQQDIDDALSAAQSVGDDHIQEMSGRVNPETWTHGSSAQRQAWFMRGYQSGDMAQCDTINAAQL